MALLAVLSVITGIMLLQGGCQARKWPVADIKKTQVFHDIHSSPVPNFVFYNLCLFLSSKYYAASRPLSTLPAQELTLQAIDTSNNSSHESISSPLKLYDRLGSRIYSIVYEGLSMACGMQMALVRYENYGG